MRHPSVEADGGGEAGRRQDREDPLTRDALNRARAVRRARKRIRLYSVHNRTGNLNTLTYRCTACEGVERCVCGLAAQPGRDEAVANWGRFRKRLARYRGHQPWLSVIEYGSTTGRIHHHFLTREQIPQGDLEDLWGHGFVVPGDRGDGLEVEAARSAAGYCSTYAGKNLEAGHGRQAYFVAQGFTPSPVTGWARNEGDALDALAIELGGFDSISRCDEWGDDYEGPPSLVVRLG